MSEGQGFDSESIITAALAKCGKVTVTADECEAAKEQTLIIDHGELSARVMPNDLG